MKKKKYLETENNSRSVALPALPSTEFYPQKIDKSDLVKLKILRRLNYNNRDENSFSRELISRIPFLLTNSERVRVR
jgi:hypothetical protein